MKAVLVIDMPTDCIKCHLADGYCWNTFPTKGRADGCPLRPLPKPKEANHCADEEFALLDRMYRCGFNACLEEITGETE